MLDLTGSAATMGELTESEVQRSLEQAAVVEARLTILSVTRDSLGDPLGVVVVDFRGERPDTLPDNDLFRQRFRAQLVGVGIQRYRDWRAQHQLSKGSDYQGALLRAGDVLGEAGPLGSLTVVGDGLSNQGTLRTSAPDLNPDSCGQTAREDVQAGRLPQLHGVTVRWVAGGRSDKPLSPIAQASLETCWKQVIDAAGGVTPPGWWSPGHFPGMAQAHP